MNEQKYFGNVLSSFENGVQLDLRVKLAVDFLKGNLFDANTPKEAAGNALDLADSLLEEAGARGLLCELPEHGDITQALRRHIERSVRAQVYQQVVASRVARDEAPLAGGGVMPGMQ